MDRHEGTNDSEQIEAARHSIAAAVEHGLTIGTAESLTGGSVAAALVSVPGASQTFEGAVVSYSHAVKTRTLGVRAELLKRVGAVDAQVAEAMAEGARRALGVDVAVSTTGVAGPEPHDGKPVGTVFIAVAGPAGTRCTELHLDGDRAEIRQQSVLAALREVTAHCWHSEISQ